MSLRSPIWFFFSPLKNSQRDRVASCNICKQELSYKTSTSNLRKHIKSKHPTVSLDVVTPQAVLKEKEDDADSPSEPAVKKLAANTVPEIFRHLQTKECHDSEDTTAEVGTKLMQSVPGPSTSSGAQPSQSQPGLVCKYRSVQARISKFAPKRLLPSQKTKIDEALLKLFTKDLQPFSIVEDEGFLEYTKALNSNYTLPSRKTVSKSWIPAKFSECLHTTQLRINEAHSVCLTTDTWTSVNNENFMAVTAHFIDAHFEHQSVLLQCAQFPGSHTALNIGESLEEIAKSWNVRDKVILVVTDNCDSMVNAVKDIVGWKHMGCFAHSLNLIVRNSLNKNRDVVEVIEVVKRIVGHFKRSCQSLQKLLEYQKNHYGSNCKPKKLVQDVPTRWNSTFLMLKRFVLLQEPLKATIVVIDKGLPILTPDQWKILCELLLILKPFYTVTKSISGERYETASLVIPLANSLLTVCEKLRRKHFSSSVNELVTDLVRGLEKRFGNLEMSNTLTLVTLLDPRFKGLVFQDPTTFSRTKERLVHIIADEINKGGLNETIEEPNNESQEKDKDELSIFYNLEECLSKKKKKGTAKSRSIIELDGYIEEDELNRKGDPLLWWRENGYQFPNMKKIVQKVFCCLATSVPCERAFSKAGLIVSDRRNRLSGNTIKMLMFLNANQPANLKKTVEIDKSDSEENEVPDKIISKNI